MTVPHADLLIVGGGINGAGIARDAAGRGLRVVLCERGDLGGETSAASSKLVHGGLRYLEQLEFRLVAESLAEREVLLRTARHLVRPMRFIMPHGAGARPGWVIRLGLFLYDCLARRQTLKASERVDLRVSPWGAGLKGEFVRGYAYSDCWVDDARLVVANAMAAAEAGASIRPRTACVAAGRSGDAWRVSLKDARGVSQLRVRAIVNATGPWVEQFREEALGLTPARRIRLVQGSHIVVPSLFDGDHAYILQNDDKRVVFAYSYEDAHTLIGTTDVEVTAAPGDGSASESEIAYLCRAANRYFAREITPRDVHWSYCGVRALVDDGSNNPSTLTRDYELALDGLAGAPVLTVYGGKLTTYRRLAERALEKLAPHFPGMRGPWTANAALPGGEITAAELARYADVLSLDCPTIPLSVLRAWVRRHGARAVRLARDARGTADPGRWFGGDLYAREVDYLMSHEWAQDADDILWRRTKAGLHFTAEQRAALVEYLSSRARSCVR